MTPRLAAEVRLADLEAELDRTDDPRAQARLRARIEAAERELADARAGEQLARMRRAIEGAVLASDRQRAGGASR